jgi:hypothetical protein
MDKVTVAKVDRVTQETELLPLFSDAFPVFSHADAAADNSRSTAANIPRRRVSFGGCAAGNSAAAASTSSPAATDDNCGEAEAKEAA